MKTRWLQMVLATMALLTPTIAGAEPGPPRDPGRNPATPYTKPMPGGDLQLDYLQLAATSLRRGKASFRQSKGLARTNLVRADLRISGTRGMVQAARYKATHYRMEASREQLLGNGAKAQRLKTKAEILDRTAQRVQDQVIPRMQARRLGAKVRESLNPGKWVVPVKSLGLGFTASGKVRFTKGDSAGASRRVSSRQSANTRFGGRR